MADLIAYGSRVQAIKGAIKGAILGDRTITSVYNQIKGTELGIRAQTFYQIAQSVQQDVNKINALRGLSNTQVVTKEQAIRAAPRENVNYSFKVQVKAYDVSGEYLYDRYLTVTSEAYRTKEEVMDIVDEMQGSTNAEEQAWESIDVMEAYYHGV